MSKLILDSGVEIKSDDCLRLYEIDSPKRITSYERINNQLTFDDYYTHKYLGYSDYSGSLECKSNQEILLEDFSHLDGIIQVHGGYGYSDLLVKLDTLNKSKELQDIIFGLDDYPSIDDQYLSELEQEEISNSYNDVIKDFRKGLITYFDYDFSNLKDDFIKSLFEACKEFTNEYWYFEQMSAWFPIDNMMEKLTREDIKDLFQEIKSEFTKFKSSIKE